MLPDTESITTRGVLRLTPYRLAALLVNRTRLGPPKFIEALRGRRQAADRWIAWASKRSNREKLVWVHAASVGETLVAHPVLSRLERLRRDVKFVHTYSSPSASRFEDSFHWLRSDYLPRDEPDPVEQVLDALHPSLLVFSRGDLWPELVFAATARGVPTAVIGAAVSHNSLRLGWPLVSMFRNLHRRIDYLGAVAEADAQRWEQLGVRTSVIRVTGDPGHDQVLERTSQPSRLRPLARWSSGKEVLVAGSTHEQDESVLIKTFASVKSEHSGARLIIVPHEPKPVNIERLRITGAGHGIDLTVWDGSQSISDCRCLVVTTTGLLADVYLLGSIAYVGGGFRIGGLHSVAEPAAFGVPVIFGPEWHSSRDAKGLVQMGGGVGLNPANPAADLRSVWIDWLENPARREQAGLRARNYLSHGAAETTARDLLALIAL